MRKTLPARTVAWVVLATALLAIAGRAADDLRLGKTVVPTRESLRLVLDADKKNYTGSAHLDLEVRERAESFRMHAEDMTLTRIVLQPLSKSSKPHGAAIEVTTASGPMGLVTLTPKTPLAPGRYTLDIDFSNDFNDDSTNAGLYRITYYDHDYLFTMFQPYDARQAFPCFDEPGFKIPWEFTAVVPEEQLVLFNTPIAQESSKDGEHTVVFEPTPPLPSYLVAFAVGPFETADIPGCGVPARVVTVQGQSALAGHAVRTTPQLLQALEAWFGQKYPFAKLDLLAVPEFGPRGSAMENPGAITFLDRVLLFDSAGANLDRQGWLATTTAHELAHMWFGGKVTMAWWDNLWLNESFADWMGNKIAAQVFPDLDLHDREVIRMQTTMNGDASPSAVAVHHKLEAWEDPFHRTQFGKGRGVLGMIEQWLGPENFRRGVVEYLDQHAWGSTTAQDLLAALSQVLVEDVSGVMATFIDQPGIPLVRLEPQIDGGWLLSQSRFHNAGVELPAQTWKIPVALEYSDGSTTHTETVLLVTESQVWRPRGSGPVAWVLPNAQARGYYRWSLNQAGLDLLTQNPAAIMQPPERISFLGNLGALLDAGIVHGDQYLAVLGRFADDPEPRVIAALAGGVRKAKESFVTPAYEDSFAVYVQRTLGPSLDRWGREPTVGEPKDVTLARRQVLQALATMGATPGSK